MNVFPRSGGPVSSFRNVPDMWRHRVSSTPDLVAMRHRVDGQWVPVRWREADRRMRRIAHALRADGLDHEDRVAVLGDTSVAWVLADMAILAAGGATTTIYPSETTATAAYILADASAKVLFCDTNAQATAIAVRANDLPELRRIVVLRDQGDGERILSLEAYEALGELHQAAHPDELDAVRDHIAGSHLATLLYTSGTTGTPKGVELTHDAWVYEAEAIDQLGVLGPDDEQFLFLPLAHVFAKVMQVTFIRLGIPTAIDSSVDRFLENMAEVRPTWMAAVPRMFEKAWARMHHEAERRGPAARLTLELSLKLGAQVRELERTGRAVPPHLRLAHAVADVVVFSRIRAAFGGRLRFCISGGAPLSAELARGFDAAGVRVCEGYGLTESCAASTVNRPDDIVFGTVGRPLPGCELRISHDGEILLRSRGVMRAYHGLPEATAEALDAEGWLHTGDVGRILPSGHLQITDRKKEILVTANGKNVAPARFEGAIVTASPLVGQAVLHGDQRPFCTAVVTLDPFALAIWADREKLGGTDRAALANHPAVREAVQQAIDDVNRDLPSYERVRRFVIAPEPFTVENGLLTPSQKVKRREVEARYRAALDALYTGPGTV